MTAKRVIQSSSQISATMYPAWIPIAATLAMIISVGLITLVLSVLLKTLLDALLSGPSYVSASFVPAVIVAYVFTQRVVRPRINGMFTRFSNFDMDQGFDCAYTIDETGLLVDQGDHQTRIRWSAIGGVFSTKGLVVFYSRGLAYYIPKAVIGTPENVEQLIDMCQS